MAERKNTILNGDSRGDATPWPWWLAVLPTLFLFGSCVFLLLGVKPLLWGTVPPGIIVAVSLLVLRMRGASTESPSRRLGLVMAGFLAGLWVFCLFRRAGCVAWPLAGASSLSPYLILMISHVVLVLAALAGILWTTWGYHLPHRVRWGKWRNGFRWLGLPAVCLVGWAAYFVVSRPLGLGASPLPFLLIALGKACLTGFGEEAFYRGLLLPAAAACWGPRWAIVFQACAYMLFHLSLTQSFLPHPVFLLVIFVLGLVFGILTEWTQGIGWAAVYHTALDMVVEWGNIC